MKVRLLILALTGLATAAFVPVAHADTIGTLTLSNCGSGGTGCPAATYSFDIGATSATLTITIAPGAVLNSHNDLIGGVNLGFVPSGDVTVTGLSTSFGGTWTFSTGSLSNNGCGSNGGAFVCAAYSPLPTTNGFPLVAGDSYTWTWDYTLLPGATIFPADSVHVGANYNPANGLIVSATDPPPVPEPGSLLLLGTGMLGLVGVVRRRISEHE